MIIVINRTKEVQIEGNRYEAKRWKEHQPNILDLVSKTIFSTKLTGYV